MYTNGTGIFRNMTLVNNTAGTDGNGFVFAENGNAEIENSIVWDNDIYFYSSGAANSVSVSYSDIQGGEAGIDTNSNGTVNWNEGNINVDPLFTDVENNIYTISVNSPCAGTDLDGNNMGACEVCSSSGIDYDNTMIPDKFTLNQNYPNPFNPTTTISYELPKSSEVMISVFDVRGHQVETLVNSSQPAGRYWVQWNASNYCSGVYFYRIETPEFSDVRKMMLVK